RPPRRRRAGARGHPGPRALDPRELLHRRAHPRGDRPAPRGKRGSRLAAAHSRDRATSVGARRCYGVQARERARGRVDRTTHMVLIRLPVRRQPEPAPEAFDDVALLLSGSNLLLREGNRIAALALLWAAVALDPVNLTAHRR